MFLELRKTNDRKTYINTKYIRMFQISIDNPPYTTVEMEYGTMIVKKRPEEIMKMIKENYNEVRHD